MNSDTLAAASSQWMVFTRNFKSGTHEPRLLQLQECTLLIESTFKDLAFNRARDPPASQTTTERRMLTAPSALRAERSIFRTRRAPSPAPLRVHALDAQVDLVEEIDDEETDLEHLYVTMQEERRFFGRTRNGRNCSQKIAASNAPKRDTELQNVKIRQQIRRPFVLLTSLKSPRTTRRTPHCFSPFTN